MELNLQLSSKVYYSIFDTTGYEDLDPSLRSELLEEHIIKQVVNYKDFKFEEVSFSNLVNKVDDVISRHDLLSERDNILYMILSNFNELYRNLYAGTDERSNERQMKNFMALSKYLRLTKPSDNPKIIFKSNRTKGSLTISDSELVSAIFATLLKENMIFLMPMLFQRSLKRDNEGGDPILWDELSMNDLEFRQRYVPECRKACFKLKQYLNLKVPHFNPKKGKQFSDAELFFLYDVIVEIFKVDVERDFPSKDYTPSKFTRSFLTNKESYKKKMLASKK
jgi:hypothetical protein